MSKKVIFIGAHPDDIELGCGAAVYRFVQNGFDVHCHFLTRGEFSGNPDQREKESRRALTDILMVPEENVHFAPKGMFSDTTIPNCHATIQFLESTYLDPEKDTRSVIEDVYAVFVHSIHDSHQDHRAVANCALSAFRRCQRLYSYESPSSTNDFRPAINLGFCKEILHKKEAAMNCHESQIGLKRWYLEYEAMMSLSAFRGRRTRHKYAEAFEVIWDEIELYIA